MDLIVQIRQTEYSINVVQGLTINDEFNENLDSGSIIIKKIPKIELEPFEEVIIRNTSNTFSKRFLVANKSVKMVNLTNGLYDFVIDLVSETKGLELIVLPNVNFKQPIVESLKESVWSVVQRYVDTYSIKRKYSIGNNEWAYENKYKLLETVNGQDSPLKQKLSSTICPEFSLNAPTLRELLNYLFSVVDYIPTVNNGVIGALDIGNTTGTFAFTENENYREYTQTAEGYGTVLVKDYEQAISENGHSRIVEKIGFRNVNVASMTLDDLTLETTFPIYRINHIYMYSWRRIVVYNADTSANESRYILVKHDITPFIVSSEYRNYLKPTNITTQIPTPPTISGKNENTIKESIKNITQYQIMTLGFDRGSKNISNWGYGYSYYDPNSLFGLLGWVNTQETFLENLICLMGYLYPYGNFETAETIQNKLPAKILLVDSGNGGVSDYTSSYLTQWMVLPTTVTGTLHSTANITLKLKSVFFELDYNALTSSRIKAHKKGFFKEESELVDNQASSLVSLELDGKNSLYKAARLANELVQFRGRYDNVSQLLPLGSINSDGYIIFKRSFSIYDNVILANYAATKHFVIKNYFTSVKSRVRNTTLMDTSNSSTSRVNRTLNVCISKEYCYYDALGDDFANLPSGFVKNVLFSAFNETNHDHTNPYKINNAIVTYRGDSYLQEVNAFLFGMDTLCFTTEMRGNQTIGTYIVNFAPGDFTSVTSGSQVKGSMQGPYVVSDTQSGLTTDLGICFANVRTTNNALLDDIVVLDSTSDIYSAFSYLLEKPKLDNTNDQIISKLPGNNNLWKNNGEIINFTTQLDYSEKDSNICFGKYFFLLNDLVAAKEKVFETYNVLNKNFIVNFYASVTDVDMGELHPNYAATSRPVFYFTLDKTMFDLLANSSPSLSSTNSVLLGDDGITVKWYGTKSNKANPPLLNNFYIQITLKKIVGISSSGAGGGTTRDRVSVLCDVVRMQNGVATTYSNQTIQFRKFGTGANEYDNFLFYNYYGYNSDDFVTFGWDAVYDNLDIYGTDQNARASQTNVPNWLYLDEGVFFYQNSKSSKNKALSYPVYATAPDGLLAGITVNKNCFVFISESPLDFIKLNMSTTAYTQYDLTNLNLIQTDEKVSDVFVISVDEYGRNNLRMVVPTSGTGTRCVCYFFYDEDAQNYKLVFGVNLDGTYESYITEKELVLKNWFYDFKHISLSQEELGMTMEYKLTNNALNIRANVNPSAYYFYSNRQYKAYIDSEYGCQEAYLYMYNWATEELVQTIDMSNYRGSKNVVLNVDTNGYYYFIYRFVCDIPDFDLKVSIYDYDSTLTSSQETQLRNNGGNVTIEKENEAQISTKFFISLMENKNNDVYDDNNMKIGQNKDWGGDDITETISNKYIDLE